MSKSMKNCPDPFPMTLSELSAAIDRLPLKQLPTVRKVLCKSLEMSTVNPVEKPFTDAVFIAAYAALLDMGLVP